MSALISDDARDLIIECEVTSKAAYEKRYQRPEWPGGLSGITIGIGYDVGAGVTTRAQLHADWAGRIPDSMIAALEPCVGVTGEDARQMLAGVRPRVLVPWDAAVKVFDQVDIPRWYKRCVTVLPNFTMLSPDCKGALLSLAYNRGVGGFDLKSTNPRYLELRAIRLHMMAKEFEKIPAEFRSMKRLWPSQSQRGLPIRREQEAKLFERGLLKPVVPPPPDIPKTPPATPKQASWLDALLSFFKRKA